MTVMAATIGTEGRSIASYRKQAASTPLLDGETEAQLIVRFQRDGDARAMARLLAAHLRMVVAIAARYVRPSVALVELVAEGNLGLVEAASRFDSTHEVRFASYATWWVRSRMQRFTLVNRRIVPPPSTRNVRKLLSALPIASRELAQRDGDAPTHEALARRTGTTVDDVAIVETIWSGRDVPIGTMDGEIDPASDEASPELQTAEVEARRFRRDRVAKALLLLGDREREIVRRRFLTDESPTLDTLGKELGVSRERVRQLEARAKQKLREALRELAAA